MRIAVVIPAYNEAGNIGPLIEETIAAVPAATLAELIVVDDASDDGMDAEIKALLGRHKVRRYLRHGRRAGQSAALRSGAIAATAPVIATMDGDGQNDPADIMRLLARLGRDGAEPAMVAGLREGRKAKGSRKATSRFANWIRDKVLADGCPDTGCGLKVYRREAYLQLPYFTSMHRYLPAFFLTYSHEIAYEPVNDRPRLRGASKYTNLGRALIGLYDLVERRSGIQPGGRRAAARLCRLSHGPGFHGRPSSRPRDLCAQHLFHLARQAGVPRGQYRVSRRAR
jgi:dolichol-phosphate mannosyltransferase